MTGSADAIEAGVGGFLEGMLPDADDFPSPAPELASNASIAGHVGLAFAVPDSVVGVRGNNSTICQLSQC